MFTLRAEFLVDDDAEELNEFLSNLPAGTQLMVKHTGDSYALHANIQIDPNCSQGEVIWTAIQESQMREVRS